MLKRTRRGRQRLTPSKQRAGHDGHGGKRRVAILYIAGHLPVPPLTGGSGRVMAIATRLVRGGDRVEVVASDASLRRADLKVGDLPASVRGNVELSLIRSNYHHSMGYTARKLEFVRSALKLTFRAMARRADVVYATSTPLTVVVPAIVRRWLRRTPYVFEVRDVWPEAPIALGALDARWQQVVARGLARTAYRSAGAIVALSTGMKEIIVSEYGVNPDKILVVPNASSLDDTDPDRVADYGTPAFEWPSDRPQRLIYGGTIGAANDVVWLIDVLERMVSIERTAVAIIGRGNDRQRLADRLAQAPQPVQDAVSLVGPMPKGSFVQVLRQASLSLSLFGDLPILATNSPNKVFDSWACGVPVAVNNGGWLADEVVERGAGLALARDPDDAASALDAWFEGDEGEARSAALDAVRTTYNWDQVATQVGDTIARVLRSPDRR